MIKVLAGARNMNFFSTFSALYFTIGALASNVLIHLLQSFGIRIFLLNGLDTVSVTRSFVNTLTSALDMTVKIFKS
jgi:hypothetical protein